MSQLLWDENIAIVEAGLDLEVDRVQWCMDQILTGAADNSTIKSFLIAHVPVSNKLIECKSIA